MKEILRNSSKMYVLFEGDQTYVLSVMCGGIGLYEAQVHLNSEETAKFDTEGDDYIESLALDIAKHTSKYQDRFVLKERKR